MAQSIRGQAVILIFRFSPPPPQMLENVEDVLYVLPARFHKIQFRSYRGEFENVSALGGQGTGTTLHGGFPKFFFP